MKINIIICLTAIFLLSQFLHRAFSCTCCYEFASLSTAANENKSFVANALSNHPLLSLFRLHASSSTREAGSSIQERLNAPSISVTRHVQRIVSSHSIALSLFLSPSFSLFSTFIHIYSSLPIAAELERLDELSSLARDATVRRVDSG